MFEKNDKGSEIAERFSSESYKNIIKELKNAIDFDKINFDKSHPNYKDLVFQKNIVEDMITIISITSTKLKPTDENKKDLESQKIAAHIEFFQLTKMIIGTDKIDDKKNELIKKIESTSVGKNKDELKSMIADLNEVEVWSTRIDKFNDELDKINIGREKEEST